MNKTEIKHHSKVNPADSPSGVFAVGALIILSILGMLLATSYVAWHFI